LKYVLGGLGDFIQHTENAIKEEILYVCTHQSIRSAENFFKPFDLKLKVSKFDSVGSMRQIPGLSFMSPVKRTLFPDTSIFMPHIKEKVLDKTIAVHPIGSKFSNEFWSKLGQPQKYIPVNVLEKICKHFSSYNFLLLGPEEETNQYRHIENVSQVIEENIWESFSYLAACECFIGVDSVFKTMSCILNVPTFVLLGNYQDETRDNMFINPYVDKGLMKVYRFNNLEKESTKVIEELGIYKNEYKRS